MPAMRSGSVIAAAILAALLATCLLWEKSALAARPDALSSVLNVPAPKRATRPTRTQRIPSDLGADPVKAQVERLRRINGARSWGYQLAGLDVEGAASAPYDLLVVDATTGLSSERHFRPEEVARLKRKPDGSTRLVVSYLSVGEAEDYRPDYFTPEYLTEDAPDWLGHENPQWKGNRIIRFCREGWQRTILGDDAGRNVYNSIEPSPLYRLIELGFDGIYLDRVDVYSEVAKDCPDAERRMVDFIARLAHHARKANPNFLVILQNAEELVRHKKMMDTIDAIAKEDLFYGADYGQKLNGADTIRSSLAHLKAVKASGRPVFVVDYLTGRDARADAKRRILDQGFIPYIGPRDLGKLWLPGRDF